MHAKHNGGPGGQHSCLVVSSPDPTLEEGKGSDEFGYNPWARERNLSAMTHQPQKCKLPLPAV